MAMLKRFEELHGDAGKALSRLIRPAICARPGRTLVWGDWSAIEARITPWLAGGPEAQEVLDVIANSDTDPEAPDIYEVEAGKILKKPATQIEKSERKGYGKVTVLSLGFGGSVGALQGMAANYGVSFTGKEAKEIVTSWRKGNPWAQRWWNELWQAFQEAWTTPHEVFWAGRVAFICYPEAMGTVYMILPDGRPLAYRSVRWREVRWEDEHGETQSETRITYRRGDEIRSLWYGELANNAVQGTAGSRLREALSVLSPAPLLDGTGREIHDGSPTEVVGHTHDEIILETDEGLEEEAGQWLYEEMVRIPDWLEGCPMASEIETNYWYSKSGDVVRTLIG